VLSSIGPGGEFKKKIGKCWRSIGINSTGRVLDRIYSIEIEFLSVEFMSVEFMSVEFMYSECMSIEFGCSEP
jgi:hypothetical protein